MAFLFSRGPRKTYRCSVLVCESAVSLTVFEVISPLKARVFYVKSLHSSLRKTSSSRQLGALISSNIYQLLHEFDRDMRKREHVDFTVAHISLFYAPPLSFAATEEIESMNKKTSELTEQSLAILVKGAEESFINRYKEVGIHIEDASSRYTIIERRISSPKLEGYPVVEYVGRQFDHFSALVSFAAIPTPLFQKLTDVCHSLFRSASVEHKSIMYTVLDEAYALLNTPTLLLGLILPDNSVLTYLRHKAPLSHSVFDGGEGHLLAHTARALSATKTIALSHATLYKEKKLQGESQTTFENALSETRNTWNKSMVDAYQSMSELFMLPKTIIVIAAGTIGTLAFASETSSSDDSRSYVVIPVQNNQYPQIEPVEHLTLSPLSTILVNHMLAHTVN